MSNRSMNRVLVVDDESSFLDDIRGVLDLGADVDILTATNGNRAVEILREHPSLRVVILDQYMRPSGVETLKSARKVRPEIRPVFVTVAPRDEMKTELAGEAVDGCFQKPIVYEEARALSLLLKQLLLECELEAVLLNKGVDADTCREIGGRLSELLSEEAVWERLRDAITAAGVDAGKRDELLPLVSKLTSSKVLCTFTGHVEEYVDEDAFATVRDKDGVVMKRTFPREVLEMSGISEGMEFTAVSKILGRRITTVFTPLHAVLVGEENHAGRPVYDLDYGPEKDDE